MQSAEWLPVVVFIGFVLAETDSSSDLCDGKTT